MSAGSPLEALLARGEGRPRPPAGTYVCPAGCGVALPPAVVMCQPHWRQVPFEVKREVIRGERWDGTGEIPGAYQRAVNAVARAAGGPLPYPGAEEPAPPPATPPGRPGEFDPLITAAVQAGRLLTAEERAGVEARHGARRDPATVADATACRGCAFAYRRNATACPSAVFLTRGLHAALAALPAATARRRCRTCPGMVTVPAGSADGGRCGSCSAQPDLFGGIS